MTSQVIHKVTNKVLFTGQPTDCVEHFMSQYPPDQKRFDELKIIPLGEGDGKQSVAPKL